MTFPNTTYRRSALDWQHFMIEHKDVPDNYPGAENVPVNPHAVLVHATKVFDSYDGSGNIAKRTRTALAKELEGSDIPVAAAHFPDLQFDRLLKAEGTRPFVF